MPEAVEGKSRRRSPGGRSFHSRGQAAEKPSPKCINFVHAMNAANHYATPPTGVWDMETK